MTRRGRPTNVVVRDFQRSDQPQARALILGGLADHWGSIDETLNTDIDDIARSYGTGRTVVVELHDRLIATGTLKRRGLSEAEIVRMLVASDQRRMGIGRLVVEAPIETAKGWGATKVVLETSSNWTDVVAFYLRCGFSISHQTDGDFGRDTWFEYALRPETVHVAPKDHGKP